MVPEEPRLYERTKYPKIFKGSYWGGHIRTQPQPPDEDEVFENRNKFVEEFGIRRRIDKVPIYIKKLIGTIDPYDETPINETYYDHCEVYYTTNKHYVIIMSPYFGDNWADMKQFFEGRGFAVHPHLYSKSTATFIKIIKKGCRK